MLYCVTGTPGAKKTAFVVVTLEKIENANKVNLVKNIKYHQDNLSLIEKFKDDFSYYVHEVGSGYDLKHEIEVLDDDYFDIFLHEYDDLRPDDYYLKSVRFNEICERINEREGQQDFKFLLPVRTIYSNINALKIDYVRSLIPDWRDAPDGSLFAVDEAQLLEPYKNIKDKDNPVIIDLTVHRHRGFDFYFITQAPRLLHPTIKVLVGVHFHLTVPYGVKTRVYRFGSLREYPNTFVNKLNCETKFYFSPPDRIFKLYKSTTINTHKKRIPYKPLIFFGLLVLSAFSIFVYGLTGASQSSMVTHDKPLPVPMPNTQDNAVNNPFPTSTSSNNVVSASTPQQQPNNQQNRIYNALTGGYYDDPLLAPTGVIKMGDKCKAYNKNGNYLSISQSDCERLLSQSGMLAKF